MPLFVGCNNLLSVPQGPSSAGTPPSRSTLRSRSSSFSAQVCSISVRSGGGEGPFWWAGFNQFQPMAGALDHGVFGLEVWILRCATVAFHLGFHEMEVMTTYVVSFLLLLEPATSHDHVGFEAGTWVSPKCHGRGFQTNILGTWIWYGNVGNRFGTDRFA